MKFVVEGKVAHAGADTSASLLNNLGLTGT